MACYEKVSIIISVYNQFNWLELILDALQCQSVKNFEVVIADDGSNIEFVDKLSNIVKAYPFEIKHVWHEDIGFRKTTILNKAIQASDGDYLIFLDGDCVPHHHFVKHHLMLRCKNCVVAARRAQLSQSMTQAIELGKVTKYRAFRRIIAAKFFSLSPRYMLRFLSAPAIVAPLVTKMNKRGILGCNFSLNRELIMKVNGFDTRYCAPGTGEDSDIDVRLRNIGANIISTSHNAIVYHRMHNRLNMQSDENKSVFEQTIALKIGRTPFGLETTKG